MNSPTLFALVLSLLGFGGRSNAGPEFPVTVPKGCEDKVLCDQVPEDYPHELVKDLVKSMNATKLRVPRQADDMLDKVVRNQYGCYQKESVIMPYVLRSNEKMKVVLQAEEFQQKIKQVECVKEGEACFGSMLKAKSYLTECQPVFGVMKFFVFDHGAGVSMEELIKVPVYCTCVVKRPRYDEMLSSAQKYGVTQNEYH